MKPFLFVSFFLISLFCAQGQQTVQNDSVNQLSEVVITDSLKSKQVTGIVPSKIIGKKIFQNYSPADFVSPMNQIPGVYVLSGALNTNRITIRGIGARTPFGTDKLRLYYNEIPVTNGTGSSTIEAYDLENLNSMEVVKGPKATSFGTNLGGAIILNPKEALGESTTLQNNLTLGSYGLLKNSLGFTHASNRLSLELRYSHMDIDGYRENNRFERDGILLNSSYQINDKNKIGFFLNYIDYTAQIASSLGQTDFDEDPTKAAFTWNAAKGFEANKYTLGAVSLSHTFNPRLKNTTSVFYTYLDHYEPRPFNILDEFTNGYGLRSRFQGDFNFKEDTARYSFGTEWYRDHYHWGTFQNLYRDNNGNGSLLGDRLSDNEELRSQWNVFGSLTIPFTTHLEVQMGLNLNKTLYDFKDLFNTGAANTSGERDFNLILLPSLNVAYTFFPGQNIYGNISRGYSNPSLEESLTPDGVINPDIAQETGTNYEVGSQLALFNNRLNIDMAVYRMDVKNLLVAQRVGEDQFIGKNAGSTKHQGVEVDMDYLIKPTERFQIKPFVAYSYSNHKFVTFIDEDQDYSGNPLTGVPKHRLNGGIQLSMGNGFYWNTTYQYVDPISLTDANTLYSEAYSLLHSRMGYRKQLSPRFSLGLNLGVNNLADTAYAQSVLINAVGFGGNEPRYFYPGNDRNFYGGVMLNYAL